MIDIFDANKVRYTTIEHLTEDIDALLRERVESLKVGFFVWQQSGFKFFFSEIVQQLTNPEDAEERSPFNTSLSCLL